MRSRVLYLSYTGLLQPLGQSQVLQYLTALARDHDISLITWERGEDLADRERLAALKAECGRAGIRWTRLRYHKAPSLPATLYDILAGVVVSSWIGFVRSIRIVHARSYVPGAVALIHKRLFGRKFVFDMRGFWPDERVDGGIWRAGSRAYRLSKGLERRLLEAADVVISLTRAGVREMEQFPYLEGRAMRFEVIPTCANLEVFRPMPAPGPHPLTVGYVGSAGVWHLFPETAACIAVLFDMAPDARLLVLNRAEQDYVRETLEAAGVDMSRVEIRSADYREVADQVARMDAAVFFSKAVFSRRASCPTKLGEFLGCGKPVLTNAGVGDVAELLEGSGAGVCIDRFDTAAYQEGLKALLALVADPETPARCTKLAREAFSLEGGVARYDAVYRALSAEAA